MGRAGIMVAGLVLVVVLMIGAAGMGLLSLLTGGGVTPSASVTSSIPAKMLALYEQAATTCPGLPWTVLAGIGTVESDNGTSTRPGVHTGANPAGAEGPMQFLPATFTEYDEPIPPGGATPPSAYDAVDAVYAAARLLCANGAKGTADIPGAVYAYNHSQAYVAEVLSYAAAYAAPAPASTAPTPAVADAVSYAPAQISTPAAGAVLVERPSAQGSR